MEIIETHLRFIWLLMLGGVTSGALIGIFFHQEDFLGGYLSFRRRLVRLGHISFFGLAFVNGIFVLSLQNLAMVPANQALASISLAIGSMLMPLCCFLSAYRQHYKILFPLPTLAVTVAIVSVVLGS